MVNRSQLSIIHANGEEGKGEVTQIKEIHILSKNYFSK